MEKMARFVWTVLTLHKIVSVFMNFGIFKKLPTCRLLTMKLGKNFKRQEHFTLIVQLFNLFDITYCNVHTTFSQWVIHNSVTKLMEKC